MASMEQVAIIGAGSAGLITAKILLDDGFAVSVFTRDRHVGGVYAQERLYPGLMMNNVHGEFHFSSLPMPPPKDSRKTGGRLSGKDMQTYMEIFSEKFLLSQIKFAKEVLGVRRLANNSGWLLTIKDLTSGATEERSFDKVVLCTGGCSQPNFPSNITPHAAAIAGLDFPVIHTSEFAREKDKILSQLKLRQTNGDRGKVVVVGGGKSAMDIAAYLSKQDVEVTMVCETADTNIAVPIPLPEFLRRSRFLAVLSPHSRLSTRLERFLHKTTIGSIITQGFWNFLHWSSLKLLGVPSSSPLTPSFHMFWTIRINDLGKPATDGFHAQLRRGKIHVAAPARAVGYERGERKQYIIISTGQKLEADAVVLATGYKSSWEPILVAETRSELGLEPSDIAIQQYEDPEDVYLSMRNPHSSPKRHSGILVHRGIAPLGNLGRRDFAVNGATFGTGNGMTHEVAAHWISSYFLRDSFLQIPEYAEAVNQAHREASFVRRRFPETWLWANESYAAGILAFNWPQLVDSLLDDMGLKSMRSGGTWWNWIFKVVDVKEIENLREERNEMRQKCIS